MRKYIDVKKELVPYSFNIRLAGEIFNLKFQYNVTGDLFTVALTKDGELIIDAEPIIYNVPLFVDVYRSGSYPMCSIVAIDESGNQDDITYDNLGITVFLTIDDQGGVEVDEAE